MTTGYRRFYRSKYFYYLILLITGTINCACSSQSTRSQEKSPNPQCHANTSRIDPYCENETWECIKESKVQKALDPLKPINEPTPADRDKFLKVVCISDTHEQLDKFKERGIPDGDILIHAGDFVNQGNSEKIEQFNQILGTLPHRTKIVVAGNHELGFDPIEKIEMRNLSDVGQGTKDGYKLLTNAHYLQENFLVVNGVKFYGASNHPLPSYPFYTARGQEMQYAWSKIPANTDVLITHTPPLGYMDTFTSNWGPERWGCKDLLTVVERIKPKFHVFGHVHEQYGVQSNGNTYFINAAQCEKNNTVGNHMPIVFYIEKKSKE